MTTPQKFLLGCGITLGVALLAVGGCGLMVYRTFSGFPEYASRERVYSDHKEVIGQVNALIVASDSLPKAQQALGAATWPDKVIYIKIKEDAPSQKRSSDFKNPSGSSSSSRSGAAGGYVDAFKRYSWTSISNVSMNGSGHGTLKGDKGEVEFVIVDSSQLNAAHQSIKYTIYIEHVEPSPASPAP